MVALTFPDLSHYNAGVSLVGAPACFAKATQGTSYVDPTYQNFRAQAAGLKIPFAAYHWLDTTDAAAQARHCFSVVGKTPLMIDDEQHTINVAHTLAFVAAYRALGGRVVLEYAPQWIWSASGKPSLTPLTGAGLAIVSSSYPTAGYTANGPGWGTYGGITPTIWQYTDKQAFNGQRVDFNAYRGTQDQLRALLNGTSTLEDDMAVSDQLAAQLDAMTWREDAFWAMSPTIRGGGYKGQPHAGVVAILELQKAVAALQAGPTGYAGPSAADIAKAIIAQLSA